ncbi:MAG: FtsX-like permease family protein [Bacillota bacterium]
MSLGQIAARNLWQNRGRYMAYLASSAFSVMIYFLYTALSLHPKLKGGYRGAFEAAQGMKAAAVVIAVFMFLFLLYSNSAFVRSRMKEFGLLSLLGVGRWQLVQIILAESLIIGTAALGIGLLTGLLFLKLFLMAVSVLLRLPTQLPFYAGPKVWAQTLTVFGSFFAIVSAISLFSVLRRNIIDLVRAGRQPKETPTFSRWKALLGLVLVVGGYVWAAFPHGVVVIIGVIPVTAMVSIGTYYLMKEGSVAFLTWLHRREGYFYRPGPFLTISQLVYKIQDNYRVLAAVTILVAVILTAVGTSVALYVVVAEDARDTNPHAIQLVQTPGLDLDAETARINAALQQHGATGLAMHKVAVVPAQLTGKALHVGLIPYSVYVGTNRPNAQALPLSSDYDAILVDTAAINERRTTLGEIREDQLQVAGQTLPLRVKRDVAGRVMNPHTQDLTDVLVLPDEVYARLLKATPAGQAVNVAIWAGETWNSKQIASTIADLRAQYPKGGPIRFSTTQENYETSILTMGLLVFIGLFVSLVFFAACCSLLYFRLFTEIDDDRKYISRLQQLGVGSGELQKVAKRQSAAIFFIPFIGGLLHSTFAMQGLGTIVSRTVLQIGWAVALGYLVLYAVLFRAINSFYWRSLRVSA